MWPFSLFSREKAPATPDSAIILRQDAVAIIKALPGFSTSTEIEQDDAGNYRAPGFWRMAALYQKTRLAGPYVQNKHDCENFAAAAAEDVAELWAAELEKEPLAQGVIHGVLPLDGNSLMEGPHALNWFIDKASNFWLRGAIDRRIKNPWDLKRIKNIALVRFV